VIGADGIRSVVRRALSPDRPRYSGTTVYRGLVPTGALPGCSESGPRVSVWLGPGQHCVWYPVSGGRWISFAAAVRDDGADRSAWRTDSWRTPGEVAELTRVFADWHPDVLGLLSAATSVTRWALYDRAPLPIWHTDRLAVIGDAAHPMLPFGAHGANQAIESAVTLASCLRHGTDAASAFRTYQRIRVDRLARVTAAVAQNARDHHLPDGDHQRERDQALAAALRLSQQDWLYGYDPEGLTPVPLP
jgi:salicylate hydroxylase